VNAVEPVLLPAGPGGRMIALYGGPLLLRGPLPVHSLIAHRRSWPEPDARPTVDALVRMLAQIDVQGRGGAGFPFARKLAAAAASTRTTAVVVNAAESEPGSSKDAGLMLATPHLVLDGAELVARALGVREIHVVVSGNRPPVEAAVSRALIQREGMVHWSVTPTSGGFVGGQSSAVLEMLAGRPNRPVTKWSSAAAGDRRRPATLLSNAETFAHTAALAAVGPAVYRQLGRHEEPGTTLLSVGGDGIVDVSTAMVGEVQHGTSMVEVLGSLGGPPPAAVLLGGYHGIWVPWELMSQVTVSRHTALGGTPALGPGIVLPLSAERCPLDVNADIVAYLSSQRARQCGPCEGGLPDLAAAARSLASGGPESVGAIDKVISIARMVNGRGACSHPDGTARLAYSIAEAFPAEIDAHEHGGCLVRSRAIGRRGPAALTGAPRMISPRSDEDGVGPGYGPESGPARTGAVPTESARTAPVPAETGRPAAVPMSGWRL